jgi:hypothetical protein
MYNIFQEQNQLPDCDVYEMYCNGLTNSVAPEPEGSSPYSQEPANRLYPEPNVMDNAQN